MPTVPPQTDLREQVINAVKVLASGGVVAIPTDTLYGLAANALDEGAVRRVFRIKGRQGRMALPLLLADAAEISRYAVDVPAAAYALVERFMPGALTIVLRKAAAVPDVVSGGADTVALRIPDHWVPRAIVRQLGAPITGTSANRSGTSGLVTADAVRKRLGSEVDLIVGAGPVAIGTASTVVDLTGNTPLILRHGAVPESEIEAVCASSLESIQR